MLHNRRYRYTLSSNALRQLQKTYRKQNYLRMRTDLAVNSVFHLNAYGFVLRYMNKVVNAFPTRWVPTFQYTRTVDRANSVFSKPNCLVIFGALRSTHRRSTDIICTTGAPKMSNGHSFFSHLSTP